MYKSPITIKTEEIARDIIDEQEKYILTQVQMCVDVDKDELLKALQYDRNQYEKGYADGRANAIKHGHWIEAKYPLFTCSECGATYQDIGYGYNYCPNCGAKMDKDEWEEPEINPCRGCVDYDGRGGCKSNGGCGVDLLQR